MTCKYILRLQPGWKKRSDKIRKEDGTCGIVVYVHRSVGLSHTDSFVNIHPEMKPLRPLLLSW